MSVWGERAAGKRARRSLLAKTIMGLAAATLALSATIGVRAAPGATTPSRAAAAQKGAASGTIVVDWNKALLKILTTPGAQPATVHATRSLAILHAAIYDAVVFTTHSGTPYLFSLATPTGARPDAAAAEAGHDVLAALYPTMAGTLDQQLAGELGAIPDGVAKQEGIEIGHLTAELLLGARTGDGSSAAPTVLPATTQPGAFRPVPPAFAPAAFTHWANVTPFVLTTADQFRPEPPPGLTTAEYAAAIDEVRSLGQDSSTTRTADQTVIAKFWSGPIWIQWNEIAEKAALDHHANLARTARLFALLNLSLADTTIAFYDAKYHYDLWRPVTAIREAGSVPNSPVTADPNWTPLITAATDPSYPGAHSAISAAAAAVLTKFFGGQDSITVSSDVLPGVVRSFDSYSAAATEAGLSRIYAGLHTRLDHDAGLRLGASVAGFVLTQAKSGTFGFRVAADASSAALTYPSSTARQ